MRQHHSYSHIRGVAAIVCAVLLCGGLSSLAQESSIVAQTLRPQHITVDVAAARLETALRGQHLSAEVYVDSKSKLLIVRGNPEVLREAARLWETIDRPQSNKPRVLFTSAPGNAKAETGPYALQHLSPRELEARLLAAWPRLSFQPEGEPHVFSSRLPGNERAVITIDHQQKTVKIDAPAAAAQSWRRVIAAFDTPPQTDETASVVPVERADPAQVDKAIRMLKAAQQAAGKRADVQFIAQDQPAPAANEAAPPAPANDDAEGAEEGEGPIGPVTIEIIEGLNQIVVRGKRRDVERVLRIIEQIERESELTRPEIEIHMLRHVNDRAVSDLIAQIYEQVFGSREARVSITPLIKPNALLLIGQAEAIAGVKDLIEKLDQPMPPQSQIRVFPLRHLSAIDAERTVRNFYVQRPGFGTDEPLGLGARVNVVAEFRSNSLIIQASVRDLAEVTELLNRLDVATSEATSEMRVFRLRNSLAEELAPVLQQAISGQAAPGTGGQAAAAAGGAGTSASQTTPRSTNLQLLRIDQEGRRLLESGILADVRITADPRGNSLLVRGPATSMELVGALIEQLDQLPDAEAAIKVFTLINGDAQTLVTSLQQLFGQATGNQGGGGAQGLLQTMTAGGDSTLVPLRFALDQRTNSVIVSGSIGDLEVVERILLRLDESDVRRRRTTVYRLRNAPAIDVAGAINQFLQSQRQVNQFAPTLVSQVEQIEREVVVVPEPVSNSLLVSATPRYYEEIQRIVEDLDRRPPMVVIQVVIAEVNLNNVDEFGVELGLQDSLLFDRGIGTVGFPFNNQPLGNNSTPQSLATRENLAGQGLTNFALGRTNSELGYGGLVLSASNESVSILIRALQQSSRIQVISRPQVQTLDNQPAFVQVGARVPFVMSSNQTQFGIQNVTELQNVGILLGVTPRTSPDGLIVMEINAENSQLSSEAEGIPISVSNTGEVLRQPQIFITTAQTTVSAQSGQTVILGGLIRTSRTQETRRTPYLSDIPVLGRLFRYDREVNNKRELLIIMTPYIVRTDEDIEMINAKETERMNWCLADVAQVHGELPWAKGVGPWNEKKTPVIFPDQDPTGELPAPAGTTPPAAGQEENRFEPIESEPTPDGVFEQQPR
jgi:general secretion pathway protein D